jgi:hypothetical protein
MGARGYGDGFNAGMVIGLPPVLNFAKEPLRSKVLNEVFNGEKVSLILRRVPLVRFDGKMYSWTDNKGHLARHFRSVCRLGCCWIEDYCRQE